MLPGGRASHGSAEAIHSRPIGPATGSPIRSSRSDERGRPRHPAGAARGAPIARAGPTFDLSTPRAKPIANCTASLAGFGHDPLRERVRSGAPEVIRPSKMDEQAAH
jgi:hypothetical protein